MHLGIFLTEIFGKVLVRASPQDSVVSEERVGLCEVQYCGGVW